MKREVTVYETVETKPMTCNLGHEHKRAQVVRRYDLAVVEERTVPDMWLAAYRRVATGTGFRAVDQFGNEWFRDWDGVTGDGPSRSWTSTDGRIAQASNVSGRPHAYDGYVVTNPAPHTKETP